MKTKGHQLDPDAPRAVAVLRVSTQMQAEEGNGLDAQRRTVNELVKAHKLNLVRTIELADVGGGEILTTPEMMDLLREIKAGGVDCIVAREWSRLLRPTDPSDFVLLKVLADAHVKLVLPDGIVNLEDKHGKFLSIIQLAVAGYEKAVILERTWGGKESRRRNGKHSQSALCLPMAVSYDKAKETFSLNGDAERVRRALKTFLRGTTNYCRIAEILGTTTRGAKLVLANPVYCGTRAYVKRNAGQYVPREAGRRGYHKEVPRDKPLLVDIPSLQSTALITKAEHARIVQIMAAKKDRHLRCHPISGRFLFRGMLRCACGGTMRTDGHGRTLKDFYVCRACRRYTRREQVDAAVDKALSEKLTSTEFLTELLNDQKRKAEAASKNTRIGQLKTTLAELDRRQMRVVENYEAGLNSREQRDQKLDAISRERAAAEAAMAEAAPLHGFTVVQLAKAAAPFANWATMPEDRKRRLLETVMPEILLDGCAVKGVSLGVGALAAGPRKRTDPSASTSVR